ncbi:MAG: SH3 domain-containing protein [Bacteroidota bacterium]
MSQPKKSLLPRLEVWIILVFFGSFIMWAVSQCNDTKQQYEDVVDSELEEDSEDETVATDTLANPASNTTASTTNTASAPSNNEQNATSVARTNQGSFTRLYVTIDKLKLRTGPSLDSAVLLELPLFSQVQFLGEMTDSTQRINLGVEMADEPWVKVRHKRGFEGWVYGAGVHYHKMKRKGVR